MSIFILVHLVFKILAHRGDSMATKAEDLDKQFAKILSDLQSLNSSDGEGQKEVHSQLITFFPQKMIDRFCQLNNELASIKIQRQFDQKKMDEALKSIDRLRAKSEKLQKEIDELNNLLLKPEEGKDKDKDKDKEKDKDTVPLSRDDIEAHIIAKKSGISLNNSRIKICEDLIKECQPMIERETKTAAEHASIVENLKHTVSVKRSS